MPLERLAGLREGIGGVVMAVGPAVAGGLLVLLDPVAVLWVTVVCSALAAAVTATLPGGVGGAGAQPERSGIGAGWAVLRGDRLLATVTLVSVGAVAVIAPLQGILLPVHLVAQDAPGVLGLTITALALGGVVGAGAYAGVGGRWPRRPVFVLALLVTSAGVTGQALLPPAPLLLTAAALIGVGMGPLAAMTTVLVAERIPPEVRGRVMGLQNAAVLAVAPGGLLAAGLLIEGIGLHPTGKLVAGLWLLVALATLLAPALRALEPAEVVPDADDR